jgi:electron transport complex protein RnfC
MNPVRAWFNPRGGIHPRSNKEATANLPVHTMPVPKTLYVALNQHLGTPAIPVVRKGDTVLRDQPLAEPVGYISAWVHAPTSGTVKSIETRITANAQLATVLEIESDGLDQALKPAPTLLDWTSLPAHELVDLVRNAGVIGMGGAGFPTQVKLLPPPGKTIQTLIINGAECEPFLTADHRLMVEQAARLWQGIQILRRILGVSTVHVVVEDDKPDAISALGKVMQGAEGTVRLVIVKTKYPQGAEKQLIYSCTRREVPRGGLPMDVGCLVENVATAAAIHDAVVYRRPLTERIITVTGDAITTPGNLLARVGTPFRDLIAQCGGLRGDVGKVICGGPMMGIAHASLDVGAAKTTSGLLLLSRRQVAQFTSMPCIACGRCVTACPVGLLPCHLSETIEAEHFDETESLNILDCIECGACAFECPAHRPLVQHLRKGKTAVIRNRRQRKSRTADHGKTS